MNKYVREGNPQHSTFIFLSRSRTVEVRVVSLGSENVISPAGLSWREYLILRLLTLLKKKCLISRESSNEKERCWANFKKMSWLCYKWWPIKGKETNLGKQKKMWGIFLFWISHIYHINSSMIVSMKVCLILGVLDVIQALTISYHLLIIAYKHFWKRLLISGCFLRSLVSILTQYVINLANTVPGLLNYACQTHSWIRA